MVLLYSIVNTSWFIVLTMVSFTRLSTPHFRLLAQPLDAAGWHFLRAQAHASPISLCPGINHGELWVQLMINTNNHRYRESINLVDNSDLGYSS